MEERSTEWRLATASKEAVYYFNTRRIVCSNGILKVWVKGVDDPQRNPVPSSMLKYELDCRAEKYRVTTAVYYERNGSVESNKSYRNPKWEEPIPDSIGEGILQRVCRKAL